jgi:FKBP-type peptidyl-prolyl cis-trans isomerase FklB
MLLRACPALLCAALAFAAFAGEEAPLEKPVEKKELTPEQKAFREKASYALGLQVGESFRHVRGEIDVEQFTKGIKHRLAGKPEMNVKEFQETLAAFEKYLIDSNAERSKTFLAENKKKEGIQETASGLQYKVLRAGTGDVPKATDTVQVHYRGTLLSGAEFDSSYARNEPVKYPANEGIKGWTEAIQTMKVGSKWQVFIPPALAYGEAGQPGNIPPNSMLIFEIELLSIEK